MDQQERLAWLIDWLIADDPRWAAARAAGELAVPDDPAERFRLYRSLVNVREPRPVSAEYLQVEDAYLQQALRERGAVALDEVRAESARLLAASAAGGDAEGGVDVPAEADSPELLLWQGDITRLAVDGIVNAANSQLLGCFAPCHGCIDNAIHTAAGVRLRFACDELMSAQGAPEPTGRAKITPGFNLPAAHVLHTVGPLVRGPWPTARDKAALASCYRSCLDLAAEHGLGSVAFCCISTGEFRFTQRDAARIAVKTAQGWCERAAAQGSPAPTVVFNVFKDEDLALYRQLLQRPR